MGIDHLGKYLEGLFHAPKPVLIPVTVMTAVIIAVVFIRSPFNRQRLVNNYLEEQAEFFADLDSDAEGGFNGDYSDLGTDIEEYFL